MEGRAVSGDKIGARATLICREQGHVMADDSDYCPSCYRTAEMVSVWIDNPPAPIIAPVAVMDDGWSEWIRPLPGFLHQCCDCGLVHEMEFTVGASNATGSAEDGALEEGVILFRARRAP